MTVRSSPSFPTPRRSRRTASAAYGSHTCHSNRAPSGKAAIWSSACSTILGIRLLQYGPDGSANAIPRSNAFASKNTCRSGCPRSVMPSKSTVAPSSVPRARQRSGTTVHRSSITDTANRSTISRPRGAQVVEGSGTRPITTETRTELVPEELLAELLVPDESLHTVHKIVDGCGAVRIVVDGLLRASFVRR